MKKSYIQPTITLVKTDIESPILSLSNSYDDKLSNTTHDPSTALSKKHGFDSLWDESWEDPEEEN